MAAMKAMGADGDPQQHPHQDFHRREQDSLGQGSPSLLHINGRPIAKQEGCQNGHGPGLPEMGGKCPFEDDPELRGQGIDQGTQQQGHDHQAAGTFFNCLQNFHDCLLKAKFVSDQNVPETL